MRRLTGILPVLLLVAILPALSRPEPPAGEEPGVLRVLVSYQSPDPFLPWQRRQPSRHTGYGALVAPNRVLAPESFLRNRTLVELLRPRSGTRTQARLLMSDPQVDLALLDLPDGERYGDLAPIPPLAQLDRSRPVEILQFDETSELQRVRAAVERVAMSSLPHAPYRTLTFTLQTESSIDATGAPVVQDGGLAGLIIDYDNESRTATMLPHSEIARFLDDVATPPYRGFATAGFFRETLVDPARRAYLGVPDAAAEQGILVVSCIPGAPASDALRANDVILEWDGHVISSLGYYNDPDYGRLDFSYLILGRRRPGEEVPVRIIRDGAEQVVKVGMQRRSPSWDLIPENVTGRPEEYLIEGGLVIRELTGRYIRSYGSDWMRKIDSRIAHLYLTRQYAPLSPGERIVILSGVLADPINIGYQDLNNQIITGINGEPIHNMADVFRIAERDRHLERISLQSIGVEVVLDTNKLQAANRRLSGLYQIPSLRYQRAPGTPGTQD